VAQAVRKHIMVVDWDEARGERTVQLMESEGHLGYLVNDTNRAMNQIYNDPPDLILLHGESEHWRDFLYVLKTDNVFRYLPVLAMFDPAKLGPNQTFAGLPIDDLLLLPLDENELRLRVRLAFIKASRYLDANPLTRLPGNFTILQTVQELIDDHKPFAIAYLDVDNFKPYNDYYGFSRGDEILRMTGRILTNSVRMVRDSIAFVGHIGGDDFVFVVTPENIENTCRQVIANFDMVAGTFYDDEESARGYIESVDRQGNKRRFSLLTISIAAVVSTNHEFTHYGEFSTACSEMKSVVKRMEGSNFVVDQAAAPGNGGTH